MSEELIQLGRITGVHGVRGWVKVHSDAEPRENIFSYTDWVVTCAGKQQKLEVERWQPHGKTLIALFKGIDDRDKATALRDARISIHREQMPILANGEFYWHQLIGLSVNSQWEGETMRLGVVDSLVETGSNDVLIVKADAASVSDSGKECMIPWVPEQFIKQVDLNVGEILVEWDPDF